MSKLVQKISEKPCSWSLASHGKLCFRTWPDDDNSVVYNALSGDTHLVDDLGRDVLQLLTLSSLTFDALTLKLAELYLEDTLNDESKLEAALNATLFQLQDAGLISETQD